MNLKPYRSAIVTLCASLLVGGIFSGARGSDTAHQSAPHALKTLSMILMQSTVTTAARGVSLWTANHK
jgi:hypothetical protein